MSAYYRPVLLGLALVLTLYTRFAGLSRGEVDFVSPEQSAKGHSTSFYAFHPDEETLTRAALELADPLDPPLTAYGMLPLYLWRATLGLADLFTEADLRVFDAARPQIYLAIRLLSIAISLATLALVWHMGRRLYGEWAAALGAFFFAASPAAIQAAHFATIDGLHALLCLGAFALSLRALQRGDAASYVLAGMLIGAAGAVRLNGLLLGPVLVAGYLLRCGGWRALATKPPWVGGGAALVTLLIFQPYLLFDPSLLVRAESTDDLGFSLQVARGEILRIWTLADVHTAPYLHYWTDLFPLACGWPLTLGFAGAVGHALWRRQNGLLLLFCGLYFAQVGGLHTKHVRYLLPLLPLLCLLAADGLVALVAHRRKLGRALSVALASYTGFYGLAFAQIYTVEDSRLQAARFIAERVPPGAVIGFERGGFSMDALVRGPRNPTRQLATATLFEARGYSTCRTDVDYLDNRLRDLDHIALIDANRYRQFTAAPDLTPAAAAFYRRLLAGELGFRVAGRFKNYPSLLGIEFRDDDAEPSFISYDHPAVYVLQRESPDAVAAALAALAQSLERDPHCPDAPLQEIAAAMLSIDWSRAEALIDRFAQDHPHAALAPMLRADIYRQTDRAEALHTARQRVKDRAQHRAAHVIPWAAGMGLLDIGLDDLAASAITEGTLKSPHFPPWAARDLAKAYILLANYAYDRGSEELAFAAYQQSSQIDPSPAAFNRLAFLAFRRGDYPLAVAFWARSVELEDDQAGIHSNLGQVHAQHLGDYPRALHHLRQAMHYDPRQRRELMPWVEMVQRKMAPEH